MPDHIPGWIKRYLIIALRCVDHRNYLVLVIAQRQSSSTHSYVAQFGPISENLTGMVMIDVSHKFWRFCFRLLGKEIVLQQGSNLTSQ